jgi:hypothetical protein
MKNRPSTRAAAVVAVAIILAVVALGAVLSSGGALHHGPESIFQDDDHLLYADQATVARTLDLLKVLGVNRVRATVEWAYIAPDPTSTAKPAGFDAARPAAYPAGVWSRYDRLVEMAKARGVGVDFDVTGPGPLWAMGPAPASMRSGATPQDYEPSARAFGQFVHALGVRYSGTYLGPSTSSSTRGARALPRVDFWSIWNEPNQPGWLAPQWRTAGRRRVPASPRLYRALVDSAVGALEATGHTTGTDTILVGESAPEGAIVPVPGTNPQRYASATGAEDAMTPMVFVRALYCVNSHYRRLTGAAASALGCPSSGSAASFVAHNPALFDASGFAHHPYFFLFAPNVSSPVRNYVPLADLGRLERGLDRAFASYGVSRTIPIYLTEYGYQTNPPDPGQDVTPAQQAAYLDEADYMAWRDPRVRAMAQFLLYDAGPNTSYPPSARNYWGSTFQTGLIYGPGTPLDGRPKPALAAYALPIWIPHPRSRPGSRLFVWGMLRLVRPGAAHTAEIQWRPAHGRGYRTIAAVGIPASFAHGYFTTRVTPPGSGSIRVGLRSDRGATFTSRAVAIEVPGGGAGAGAPAASAAGGGAAGPSASASVTQAYALRHVIAPCEFTAAALQRAQSSVPNDELQYDQDFVAAIELARQEQASGACAHRRGSAVSTTTAAGTPAPPPAAPLGRETGLDVGSPTAATDAGWPAPIVILFVLGGLLAVAGAVLGAARMRGWDPAWAARVRHSWGEAGFRVSGVWSEFEDWLRRGR